ncbi:MAG: hypothetical protein GX492_10755 [Firmicutes bacterium]|nr:hypothetical protein [Bacillota bacterium]
MDFEAHLKHLFREQLQELGFTRVEDDLYQGRVPAEGTVDGWYIDIQIHCKDYPISAPRVELKGINGDSEVFRCVPPRWRHLDEQIGYRPAESRFWVCCLHNWFMNSEFDARYIYNRIEDWLSSNVTQSWAPGEDAPAWRLAPQLSDFALFVTETLVSDICSNSPRDIHLWRLAHDRYVFRSGSTAANPKKNPGNKYDLEQIEHSGTRRARQQYLFFPEATPGNEILDVTRQACLGDDYLVSLCCVVKLDKAEKFKTAYQLLSHLKGSSAVISVLRGIKEEGFNNTPVANLPIIVQYESDQGRLEIAAFVVDLDSFLGDAARVYLKPFRIETLPQRKTAVDLNVALLGVGSLGSQIAKVLVDKGVKSLTLSDFDYFSASNLGHHELTYFDLGFFKVERMQKRLLLSYDSPPVRATLSDEKAIQDADIVVVAVGSSSSFDRLAFKTLADYPKPIVWVWTSPHNVLSEVVITHRDSGCLNCYYMLTQSDNELRSVHEAAKRQIALYPVSDIDMCGNPHVISQWDRMVLLATQVVTLLAFYSEKGRFPFEYVNYLWKTDDIYPKTYVGHINANPRCPLCRRG